MDYITRMLHCNQLVYIYFYENMKVLDLDKYTLKIPTTLFVWSIMDVHQNNNYDTSLDDQNDNIDNSAVW